MKIKRIVVLFGFDMESDVGSWSTEANTSFKEFLWKNTGDYACRQLDKLFGGLVDRGSE